VYDEHGADLIVAGGAAMVAFARENGVELALLTEGSAACGSQVVSYGCRLTPPRFYQTGVGVATAMLLEAGVPVVNHRDFRTLGALRARLDPGFVPDLATRDHHEGNGYLMAFAPGRERAPYTAE